MRSPPVAWPVPQPDQHDSALAAGVMGRRPLGAPDLECQLGALDRSAQLAEITCEFTEALQRGMHSLLQARPPGDERKQAARSGERAP